MVHDSAIIDFLEARASTEFDGIVFRATRAGLDPLTPSTTGGRWMVPDRTPVLYTSVERAGAIAEIAYHWGLLLPRPTKPAAIHEIAVRTAKTVRVEHSDFASLGIDATQYKGATYARTQEIGAAAAFLGFDGLLVPSARANCENLILFLENHRIDNMLSVTRSESVHIEFDE